MISLSFIHPINYLEMALLVGMLFPIAFFTRSFLLFFLGLHGSLFWLWQLRNLRRYNCGDVQEYLAPLDGKVVEIKHSTSCQYLDGTWKCISIQGNIGDSVLQYAPIEGAVVQEKFLTSQRPVFPTVHWLSWLQSGHGILVVELQDMINHNHCLVETSAPHHPRQGRSIKPVGLSFPITKASVIGSARGLDNLFGNIVSNLYVPMNTNITIEIGQTTIAGETVIARKLDRILLPDERHDPNTSNTRDKSGGFVQEAID